MSWTECFPVLTDEMVDAYERGATESEKREYDEWFAVDRVVNRRESPHVAAFSLFWKHINQDDGELPSIDREVLTSAEERGLVKRFPPWEHYVEPLLEGARRIRSVRPEVAIRVYLAADMSFLTDELTAEGCEVYLMKSSSIRHNPGAMWRFLALEERGRLVTISDADRAPLLEADIERTELMSKTGLGFWRVPVWGETRNDNAVGYRPILACQMGSRKPIPAGRLMKAIIWHTRNGTIEVQCKPPGCGQRPIFGTSWPDYGFDEWFLQSAIYPRAAMNGILSFVPASARSTLLPLDIEYCTWANPRSEIVYFGRDGACCKPPPGTKNGAKSRVLKSIEKSRRFGKRCIGRSNRNRSRPLPPITLVVARYRENLDWLLEVDRNVRVVVYNKGPGIADSGILNRIDRLESLPNRGREADTYLAHLQKGRHPDEGEWTVFSQGDPFPHSPDFLALLSRRSDWNQIQPLTAGFLGECPPAALRTCEVAEWFGNLKVRSEFFSPWTLETLGFQDEGVKGWFGDYRDYHGIAPGWSMSGHFLELCGLHDLAREAWTSYVGQFAYGAIFAVGTGCLDRIPRRKLARMRKLAAGHPVHGFLYERLWLHLFGLPFAVTESRKLQTTTPSAVG